MKKVLALAIGLPFACCLIQSPAKLAQAQSSLCDLDGDFFDLLGCAGPPTEDKVETAIKNNSELSGLARKVNELFEAKKAKLPSEKAKTQLNVEQYHWLRTRDKCGPRLVCLKDQHLKRVGELWQ